MNCDLHFVAHKSICLCAMLIKFIDILVSQGGRQGASQGGSSSARSFDLPRPGVRDETGSLGHGSPGQRFWPGRVGSRVSVSDPVFDPVFEF